jgi:hypothetical protein
VYSNAVFGTASKPHAMDRAFTPSGTFPSTPQTVSYTVPFPKNRTVQN